jgi:PIN domain nuclease of toxin-antitoxin system
VNLLLDTCALLWLASDPAQLGSRARAALSRSTNLAIAHQASLWEMQIKFDRGRLSLDRPPLDWLRSAVELHDLAYHWIEDEAIAALADLPDLHRDPFDRMLIAHAKILQCSLLTPDPEIHKYPGVKIIWA